MAGGGRVTDVDETTRLRTDLALAEQRIVALEHERDRLAAALRAAVEAFTRPHCPDGPPHEAAA
jgi:hypothetical protein